MDDLTRFLVGCNDVWAGTLESLRLITAAASAGCTLESALGPRRPASVIGGVGIVPIHGTINYRQGFGADLVELQNQIRAALDDSSVRSILLDINSGGGTVTGLPEAAEFIRRARDVKPIHAHANAFAASAAYWLGSQATTFSALASGHVGSLGVRATHIDFSGMAEQLGVKFTTVSSRKYKAEMDSMAPLSPEAKARLQEVVNAADAEMMEHIAGGRGEDPKAMEEKGGEGRMFTAREALDRGLIDRLETTTGALQRLTVANSGVLTSRARTVREFEAQLRDLGYSRTDAKRLASGGFGKNPPELVEVVTPVRDEPGANVPNPDAEKLAASIRDLTEVFK